MPTQKIAITIPPPFLKRLDDWAKKMGKTRSRFIVEELDHRLWIFDISHDFFGKRLKKVQQKAQK